MNNAANKGQVKDAGRKEKDAVRRRLMALKEVLSTKPGRDVLWWFLEEAGIHKSVWAPSAAIHYNAGKQDFGHFLEAQIVIADQEALFQMMRDQQKGIEGDSNARDDNDRAGNHPSGRDTDSADTNTES